MRELQEELGAVVNPNDLVFLVEKIGTHLKGSFGTTVTFFWHDRMGTITGCYEGIPAYFSRNAEVQRDDRVRPHTKECVQIAFEKGLVG